MIQLLESSRPWSNCCLHRVTFPHQVVHAQFSIGSSDGWSRGLLLDLPRSLHFHHQLDVLSYSSLSLSSIYFLFSTVCCSFERSWAFYPIIVSLTYPLHVWCLYLDTCSYFRTLPDPNAEKTLRQRIFGSFPVHSSQAACQHTAPFDALRHECCKPLTAANVDDGRNGERGREGRDRDFSSLHLK